MKWHLLKHCLSVLGLLLLFNVAVAQFNQPCVDPGRVDPFYQCNDPSFIPVCGCDQVTYRNECVAFRNGGVNQINYTGVCQNDYIFATIYPTFVADAITLYLQFYDKGSALIQIRNSYGNVMFSQNYLSLTSRQFSIARTGYEPGIYYCFVISGNVSKVIKFVII
ncbi:MAG: hypothetical protein KC517_10960 [Bacteroidetes bacterium]|jgi:hypothetical protein|nr:hypothetical protein [Bacteroidota bacterium]